MENQSRRNFIKKAMKVGVGIAALGLAVGSTDGQVEQELFFRREVQYWKEWEVKLSDYLLKTEEWVRSQDPAKLPNIDPKYKHEIERGVKQLKEILETLQRIKNLMSTLQDDKLYHLMLAPIVKSNEESKEFIKIEKIPEIIDYEVSLKYLETILRSCKYAAVIKSEFDIEILPTTRHFFESDIESVYLEMKKFPPFLIRRAKIGSISIADPIIGAGHANPAGSMVLLSPNSRTKELFPHELTHYMSYITENFWKFWQETAEEKAWKDLNRGAEQYTYGSGAEAIISQKMGLSKGRNSQIAPKGYARLYGLEGNTSEDKASLSEGFFFEENLKELLTRCATDPILKKKVEFMTGYRLDHPWMFEHKIITAYSFGSKIPDSEYLDAGFPSRDYWSKWSEDDKGKVWMDADYYNSILAGKSVTFEEIDGKTIRKIDERSKRIE